MRGAGEAGFTLVELMVVIAIIGFASAAVLLSIPDPRGRLVDDADRFAVRLAATRDYAVMQARPAAIWVSPSAYGFESYGDGRWDEGSDAPFAATQWSTGTQIGFGGGAIASGSGDGASGQQGGNRLMLNFDSTGVPGQAARVELHRDGERISVTLDGAGKVRVGE